MKRQSFFFCLTRGFICCLLLYPLAAAHAISSPFNVGFMVLPEGEDTPLIGIWYPSNDEETEGKLGPFRPRWAWDGAPAAGTFPVILLSHGITGHWRNHRQTAAALVRQGYVVAAPLHAHDREMTSLKTIPPVVRQRAQQLAYTLQRVKDLPDIGAMIDSERVGVLGYSLGTLTALTAAGATADMALFRAHCKQHGEEDVNFCGSGWQPKVFAAIRQALDWLREKGLLKPRAKEAANKIAVDEPIDLRAMALVAPIGAPFAAADVASLNVPIALYRLGDDEELRAPYHAEHLRQLLGERARVYKIFPDVHHYAFISPFPQWLLEEEEIPVAMDPAGFNRPAFIREINGDIVRFFSAYL